MIHATLASAKAALRVAIRNRRKALSRQFPEAHWMVAEVARPAITERFPDAAGKVCALYHALGSELDPGPLGEWLVEEGWTLALPFVDEEERMSFRRWAPGDEMSHDRAALPSPRKDAEAVDPDLIIAPLLAFDRFGGRLGQGAGWYDRTIEALRARKEVLVVGFAYSGQEVARTPAEAHDQRLDAILTEAGWRDPEPYRPYDPAEDTRDEDEDGPEEAEKED